MTTKTKKIYNQIFMHPVTHNLEWRDLSEMFSDIGEVEMEHNGNAKVTVRGESAVFHTPMANDTMSPDQIIQIRHLIRDAIVPDTESGSTDVLVVMDHAETKVYHSEGKESEPETVLPFDPHHLSSHVHTKHVYAPQHDSDSKNSYFMDIATSIGHPKRLLLFGSGNGSSSTMEQFVTWLHEHKNPLAKVLLASVVVDESHLTDGQILAKAREMFAAYQTNE